MGNPGHVNSGYCNRTLPRTTAYDPHTRCRMPGCTCECHTILEPLMPDPTLLYTGPSTNLTLDGLTVPQVVALVAAAANRLSETAMDDTLSEVPWREAILHLDTLRAAVHTIKQVDNLLTRHVYLTGEHGTVTVEGLGTVKVMRSRDRRKWDERGVAQAVLDVRLDQRAGEGIHDAPAPWDVIDWLLEVVHVDYARSTALKALGLTPADFCEDTPGALQVSLPPRT